MDGIERCIDDEIPFEIPSNWCWCRAETLLSISSGDGLTTKEMDGGKYPVYGGNGITGYHSKYNVDKQNFGDIINKIIYRFGLIS